MSGPNQLRYSGAPLIGYAISSVLYGMLCGQVVWFFRRYPNEHRYMKYFVAFILLTETGNFFSGFAVLWHNLIRRGFAMPWEKFVRCGPWALHVARPFTETTCLLVEAFFIRRMWIFADQKRLAQFTVLPFLCGWGCTIAYLVGMVKYSCFPQIARNRPLLVASYCFRIISDGLIAFTMTYTLYKRSTRMSFTSSVRTVRGLIGWMVTTGLLMWLSAIAFIVTQLRVGNTLIPIGVYFLRGRIYANAMLAQLNDRERYRVLANKTRTMDINIETTTSGSIEQIPSGDNSLEQQQDDIEMVPTTPSTRNL
ncbi:hypothetical protein BDQ12DRAFT_687002 [Crucibulum laeve]|uniref:DUF6534 domain-containing protein n=1 Tax=Crucibulum laeve TaxID=68775 RepID=A0A5C3LTF2_9AGAR|nr:hypothetical protein BDQ12DRAFT_687002 [Crucibulum laeve]